jgi:hypothetical protein
MVANSNKGKPAAKKAGKDDKSPDETVLYKFGFYFYISRTINQLLISFKFDPIKVDARLANTAVLMLDSPEEEVLQKACESIFKFCEKSN